MSKPLRSRSWLALGASAAALLAAAPAFAQNQPGGTGVSQPTTGPSATGTPTPTTSNTPLPAQAVASQAPTVSELVVTAERRQEAIQTVPVAVSAFSQDTLKTQRLDGGQNLELSVPNVNFSRGNFGGYNFQIRGIGTKVVSPTGDPGVSVSENFLPLQINHLADTDFYDVERVEVLRGPQGTLYGRAATGGAVNVITAKPTDRPGASITAEYGNYNDKRVLGYINAPLGDMFALRLAGFWLNRDGYGTNLYNGDKVDGRDLFSTRATLSFKPTNNFRAYLMWEHFEEKDNRNRVGKQLCIKDPGPTNILGVPTSPAAQGLLSQGCLPGSIYQPAAYGTLNSSATLGGLLTNLIGLTAGDVYANHPLQNTNLHDIESVIDPVYQASQDILLLNVQWDLTDNLTLESITGYNHDTGYSYEDYNRIVPRIPFTNTGTTATGVATPPLPGGVPLSALFFPGGFVVDPQVGTSNYFRTFDYGDIRNQERTEEVRLTSSFKGPLNFALGFIYVNSGGSQDYDVFSNGLTAFAIENNGLGGALITPPPLPPSFAVIDPTNPPSYIGHNYYDARFDIKLLSYGYFGELYYDLTDTLRFTGGIRYTEDDKSNVFYPIELLPGSVINAPPPNTGVVANPAYNGGSGFAVGQNSLEKAKFTALTGRVNLDWRPHLSFTDQTLIYASYSRGYQGGGFNTPCASTAGFATAGNIQTICGYPAVFQPVFVDAFELGTKNTLMGGRLVLNGDVFYYKETGYQISTIVNKSSVNQNINADLWGAEFEGVYSPVHNLTFNANIGYLGTRITSGRVIDQLNLTQGDPSLHVVKASDGSNCVVTTQGLATLLAVTGGAPGSTMLGVCGSTVEAGSTMALFKALGLYNYGPNVATIQTVANNFPAPNTIYPIGIGIPVNLVGKQLPNSPHFTVSIGAQYVWELAGDWRATLRGDYYWQDSSYARIFNTQSDFLKSWDNVNATLNLEKADWGLSIQLFVKNALNSQPITDLYLTDASSGLFENTFTLDPRTFGIAVTKRF